MRHLTLLLLLYLPAPVLAQTSDLTPAPVPVSVYRLSPPRDLAITGLAASAILIPYAFATHFITPHCPCDPASVNSFDRGAIGNSSGFASTIADLSVGAAVLTPLALDYLRLHGGPVFLEDAGIFVQTLAVNGALTTAVKYLAQRPFPAVYAGNPGLIASPAGYRAFYSGHTALVMAALTSAALTARLRHRERTWPWVVALLVGTSVGIEMVAAGRHFPTDVIAGGLAGSAVGIAVPLLHRR